MLTRGMERDITAANKDFFEKHWIIKNDNLMKVEKDNLKFEGFEWELISDISASE